MDLHDKRIVVTGGAGFLGRAVCRELFAAGVQASQLIIPRSADCDLRRWDNCAAMAHNADIIIHLAARVGGIGFNREHPGSLYYDNLIMGAQLMEAARQANVAKFVALGTICAYPKFTPVPFSENDFWNGYPEETNAPYGLAKKAMLVQAQAYRQEYGMNAIYLLPVNLYGPHDEFDPARSHVIPALIRKIEDAKQAQCSTVKVWGSGSASREFLYVDDAARGIVAAAQRYDSAEPVNLGAGMEISIRDLVTTLCELMNYRGTIEWDSSKPDGQPRRMLDVSRAAEQFGFRATTSFVDGLRQTIAWYRNQLTSVPES